MHTRTMDSEFPIPQTQYAESDGLSIAYQVFGSGTIDLVFVPGLVTHIELNWDMPGYAPMMRKLGEHFRVILFDKRGQGLSDRFEGVPTLEERMDDVRDVMRAAGSTRAVLLAYSEGGAMGALFAATHPEMVERLILLSAMARFSWAPDYPHSPTIEQIQEHTAATWAKPESVRLLRPAASATRPLPKCSRVGSGRAARPVRSSGCSSPMTRSTCAPSCRRCVGRR